MICVIDYGMGNLRSVGKALEHMGARVRVSDSPKQIAGADKLVLPGVGEFGSAVRELKRRRLVEPILKFASQGKPFLGICLGLQLLFETSEESPGVRGLSILKGKVRKFKTGRQRALKIPQIGWNQVAFNRPSPFLKGVKNNSYFYFVHSYYSVPDNRRMVLGETQYGVSFPSVVGSGSIFAVQFHPEKSQDAGLAILRNFVRY